MLPAVLLQAAVAGPVLPRPRVPRDLAPCPVGEDGDVVVCAPDQRQFRLGPAPRLRADGSVLPRAQMALDGKTDLSAETDQAGVGGFTSNRGMIRLKRRF